MELDRRLLLAHCAAHALSIAAGLLVVVPMALSGSAFKGRCALFSAGYWRTENRDEEAGAPGEVSQLVVQQWGPPEACQLATFVGIFTVLYGAAQSWRCFFYLYGRHDDTLFSSFLTVLLSVCVLFLSGGASVILSLGLVSWCDTVTDNNKRPYRVTDRSEVMMPHGATDRSEVMMPHGATDRQDVMMPHGATNRSDVMMPHGATDRSDVMMPHGATNRSAVMMPHGATNRSDVMTPYGAADRSKLDVS